MLTRENLQDFESSGAAELAHVVCPGLTSSKFMCVFTLTAFNLDFYTEVLDLQYLLQYMEGDQFLKKYKKLNEALIGLVQDYSLVSFVTLNIQDRESTLDVLKVVDKANGYVFGDLEERNMQTLMSCAVGADFEYFKYPLRNALEL